MTSHIVNLCYFNNLHHIATLRIEKINWNKPAERSLSPFVNNLLLCKPISDLYARYKTETTQGSLPRAAVFCFMRLRFFAPICPDKTLIIAYLCPIFPLLCKPISDLYARYKTETTQGSLPRAAVFCFMRLRFFAPTCPDKTLIIAYLCPIFPLLCKTDKRSIRQI